MPQFRKGRFERYDSDVGSASLDSIKWSGGDEEKVHEQNYNTTFLESLVQ